MQINMQDVVFVVQFDGRSGDLVSKTNVNVTICDVRARQYELASGRAEQPPGETAWKVAVACSTKKQRDQLQSILPPNDAFIDVHFIDVGATKRLKTVIDRARRLTDLIKTKAQAEVRDVFDNQQIVLGRFQARPETARIITFLASEKSGIFLIQGVVGSGKSCLLDTALQNFLSDEGSVKLPYCERFFFFQFQRSTSSSEEQGEVYRFAAEFANWQTRYFSEIAQSPAIVSSFISPFSLQKALIVVEGLDDLLDAAASMNVRGSIEKLLQHCVAADVIGLKLLGTARRSIDIAGVHSGERFTEISISQYGHLESPLAMSSTNLLRDSLGYLFNNPT